MCAHHLEKGKRYRIPKSIQECLSQHRVASCSAGPRLDSLGCVNNLVIAQCWEWRHQRNLQQISFLYSFTSDQPPFQSAWFYLKYVLSY